MTQTHRPIAAALWMLGSIFGFSVLAVSARQIGPSLDTFEMMLYRSMIGIVAITCTAFAVGRQHEIQTRDLGLHALRNVIHFAGQNLWLFALALIPMAQLFALEFSYPIMVTLAAPFFLSERLTGTKLVAAAVGFSGILIVARPFGVGGISIGLIAALACALCFAGTAIVTKKLTRKVTIICILFWLAVMQTALALILSGWDGDIALPDAQALPWVVVMGLSGLFAHLGLTKALSLAPASIVTPIDFMRLPLIALVGMVLYAEPLDIWVILGGAIIFSANLININAGSRYRSTTTST